MRSIPLMGGLALALALGGRLVADPVPYNAAVTVPEVDVRSGPSADAKFYPTNRLRKGDVVQVLKERPDGWLEIRPPEGSFSWINMRFLTQLVATQPYNFVVVAQPGERIPVLVGGELGQGKPTVVGAGLERQTLVRRYQKAGQPGALYIDSDGTWLPIEPPAAEVRYLTAAALAKAPTHVAAAASAPARPQILEPAPVGGSNFSPAAVPPSAPTDKPTHAEVEELWNRAVAAERAGNVTLALQLYTKAASQGMIINSDISPRAIQRANFLVLNGPTTTGAAPLADSRARPMTADPVAPPSVRLSQPSSAGLTSADQRTGITGATFTTSRQASDSVAATQWIGRLRHAGRGIGDRPTFVLESANGFLYANPAPGVDLESHVGQNVELFGTATYYGQIRAYYMAATQVRVVQ